MVTVAQRYRREAWLLGAGAIYVCVFAVIQHFTGDVSIVRFLDNVRWTLDCVLGCWLLLLGRREANADDRLPRHWFLVGWCTYTVGQFLWNIQVYFGWMPFPGPSDLFYISLPLFVSSGFLTVLLKGLSSGERRAISLDLASIVVMSLTLTLALYVPLWTSSSAAANVTAILYPVLYLTAFGIAVLTVLIRRIRLSFSSVLTIVSLFGWACCWLDWNLRVLRKENLDATLFGYMFSIFMLLAAAALGKWRSEMSTNPSYARLAYRVQRLFPLVLVFAACVALVFGHRHFNNIVIVVIDIGAVAMIVLAATRQVLVLYEQDQILEAERRLRESEQREAESQRRIDRIRHDLSIARSIQQGLLPKSSPNVAGYDIAGWNDPADETGGDYYDWQLLDNERVVISIADAAGHGIGSALVTSVCRAYARACMDGASRDRNLQETLGRVNRLLAGDVSLGRFVTFVAALLDASQHRIEVLSAGHGPLFHYTAATRSVRAFNAHGLPLAVTADAEFDAVDSLVLAPGDFVAVFTDGFFEWPNAQAELFGDQRLADALVRHAHRSAAEMIESVRADLAEFVGATPQEDDLTAVVIKRTAEQVSAPSH